MSTLFYGNTNDPNQQIILYGLRILDYDMRHIADGPTYLYTRHTVTVEGYYNPALNSYAYTPQAGAAGQVGQFTPSPGFAGATSNRVIQEILMTPRLVLQIDLGNDLHGNTATVLLSPQPIGDPATFGFPQGVLYDTDATFGPHPLDCDVTFIGGIKTYRVVYRISTDLNQADQFCQTGTLSAILSHRWTMSETIDQDFFSTIYTRGHVVFRGDRMRMLGSVFHAAKDVGTPDDWRCLLVPAQLAGYKRERLDVFPSEDGLSLEYVCVDRLHGYGFDQTSLGLARVTRMEVEKHVGAGQALPTSVEALAFGLGAVKDIAGGFGSGAMKGFGVGAALGSVVPGIGTVAGGVIGAVGGGALGAAGGAASHAKEAINWLPKVDHALIIRIWGDWYSTRNDLLNVINLVVANTIGSFIISAPGLVGGRSAIALDEDLMGRFLQATLTFQSGPLAAFLGQGNVQGIALLAPAGSWPATLLHNPPTGIINQVTTLDPGSQVFPALSLGTRTRAVRLVPQDPGAPCSRPRLPSEIATGDTNSTWPVLATDELCTVALGANVLIPAFGDQPQPQPGQGNPAPPPPPNPGSLFNFPGG